MLISRPISRPIIFVIFTSAYLISYFYRSVNAVIAPTLLTEMSLNASQLGFMTSLYFAAFALTQIPLGVGLDKWGPRLVTSGLMLICVVGSIIFAFATSFVNLCLGRALIGMGMAGVLMGALKALSQWYPAKRFATVSSLLVGIGSTGALFAATPLVWFSNAMGWRAVFMVGAIATLVIATMIVTWTRNAPPDAPLSMLSKQKVSMRTVYSDSGFWRIAPLNFFMTGTLLSYQGLWAGPYLYDVKHVTEITAGNLVFLMSLGVTVGFLISGWLADILGLVRVIAIAAVVFVACQLVLALNPPLAIVGLSYVLFGFTGAFSILLLAHCKQIFPVTITGQALTGINIFGIGGTFILQWCIGFVINTFAVDSSGHYPTQAYQTVLIIFALINLVVLAWYLPIVRRNQGDVPSTSIS